VAVRANGVDLWEARHTLTRAIVLVSALAGLLLAYCRRWRQAVLTWGATPEEAAHSLPSDDLLAEADIVATRAITIDAPPSAVWAWLVQMGPGRGGAHTYDWIENLLGLDIHSVDRIVPELQCIEVGDVPRSKEGSPGMRVEILDPERVHVGVDVRPGGKGDAPDQPQPDPSRRHARGTARML
jgi:hypothetical protein